MGRGGGVLKTNQALREIWVGTDVRTSQMADLLPN